MRQTGQGEIGHDHATQIEIHDLSLAFARGTDDVDILLVEEKIVEIIGHGNSIQRKGFGRGQIAGFRVVIVHPAGKTQRRIVGIGNFPDFGDVF